ncbi:MAG TPA: molybdate ABC transporter substrate-binding protein [Terriglobales bacterium]|nr:molybdate ABC transporter substrate-binding protein [Terriglobales bacterium]
MRASFLLFTLTFGMFASAEELRVAAASDLTFALPEIVAAFERQTGHNVRVTYGSSGNFYAQIQHGAPFDVLLSADVEYPRRLEQAGIAGAPVLYAIGRIVVWAPRSRKLNVRVRGPEVLRDPAVRRIAIANPRHAPYGRAAEAALKHFGLYEQVASRIVLGENISQAAQFVQSGSAEVGIIALALAEAPTMRTSGEYWLVPQEAHSRLEQAAAIRRSSPHANTARQFLQFLRSQSAQAVLRRYGFELPEVKP